MNFMRSIICGLLTAGCSPVWPKTPSLLQSGHAQISCAARQFSCWRCCCRCGPLCRGRGLSVVFHCRPAGSPSPTTAGPRARLASASHWGAEPPAEGLVVTWGGPTTADQSAFISVTILPQGHWLHYRLKRGVSWRNIPNDARLLTHQLCKSKRFPDHIRHRIYPGYSRGALKWQLMSNDRYSYSP